MQAGRQSVTVIITGLRYTQPVSTPLSPDMRRAVTDQQTQDVDPILF